MEIRTVTRQSDAHGGHCAECAMFFNITSVPYWHWSKSVRMHRNGTGHKVTLYQIVMPS